LAASGYLVICACRGNQSQAADSCSKL